MPFSTARRSNSACATEGWLPLCGGCETPKRRSGWAGRRRSGKDTASARGVPEKSNEMPIAPIAPCTCRRRSAHPCGNQAFSVTRKKVLTIPLVFY